MPQNDDQNQIYCDACIDDYNDVENGDDMVICDKCNVAVHQSCYGHDLLNGFPQGDWFCQRCLLLMKQEKETGHCDPQSAACALCNGMKGALVETNLGWVHLTCVNWMPDIWFKTGSDYKIVEGKQTQGRGSLSCCFCRRRSKHNNYCIQCDYKDCPTSFHVRCAISEKLIKAWHAMEDHVVNDRDWQAYIFCKKHLKPGKDALRTDGLEGILGKIVTASSRARGARKNKQINGAKSAQ